MAVGDLLTSELALAAMGLIQTLGTESNTGIHAFTKLQLIKQIHAFPA